MANNQTGGVHASTKLKFNTDHTVGAGHGETTNILSDGASRIGSTPKRSKQVSAGNLIQPIHDIRWHMWESGRNRSIIAMKAAVYALRASHEITLRARSLKGRHMDGRLRNNRCDWTEYS